MTARARTASQSRARSVFHDARPLGPDDPVVRPEASAFSALPALEEELAAVAGGVFVREASTVPEGVDDELQPGRAPIPARGLSKMAPERRRNFVAGREIFGPSEKDEGSRAARPGQLADGELLVFRREEAALSRVVGVDLPSGAA